MQNIRHLPAQYRSTYAEILLKRLEEYRGERRQLVQELKDLDARARVVQLEFDCLCKLIAPIPALPEEVLAMIFEAGTRLKQETGLHFSILVSHVTRSWRNIALATPRLWATIRCDKPKDMKGEPYPETGKERTAAFLARSRSLPVDLYIRHFVAEDFEPGFVRLFSQHVGHLSITDVDSEDLAGALKYLSHHKCPLLQSFELAVGKNSFSILLDEPLFSSGAPHLITAQIDNFDLTSFHFCLPAFQSVTRLRLTTIYMYDDDAYESFRDGIMALPSLNHLELQDHHVEEDLSRRPVVLPALQILYASSTYMYGFLDFLGPCIHAASLTVLALQGNSQNCDAPEVHFPSLRHLILLNVTREVPGFGILNQFPTIQRLTCQTATRRARSISDQSLQVGITDVLAALGPGPHEDGDTGRRTPCPRLHTVAVSATDKPLDAVALTSQISMLQDNGIPIRQLMLPKDWFAQAGVHSEDMAELRAVVEIEDFQIDWPTPFANDRFTI